MSRTGELLDCLTATIFEFPLIKKGLSARKLISMERRHLKFISALMALLMFVSPLNSLAMQPAVQPTMSESYSSPCHGLDSDLHSSVQSLGHEDMHSAQCMMENCADVCASLQHCSSQAPIILSQADHQGYVKAQRLAIEPLTDSHLSVHPPGLYRPPRA